MGRHKVGFERAVGAVQPRIRLMRSSDQRLRNMGREEHE